MNNDFTASEISSMLMANAESLVSELLPLGKKDGREWKIGSVAGEAGASMSVCLHGSKAGVWADFASGEKGDILDLVAHVLFAGDKGKSIRWAKGWLGLSDYNHGEYLERKRQAQREIIKSKDEADKVAESRRNLARAMWNKAGDMIVNTPVRKYLWSRGIDILALPKIPGALRFISDCYSSEDNRRHPAMVAAVHDGNGDFIALHRTYLKLYGSDLVRKADLEKTKAVLGSYRGGHIALNRGASGKRLKDAPDGDSVIITEGIEDGLSIALACPEKRVLAAISLGNFGNVSLPPAIRKVIIAADNDEGNAQAALGLERACNAFLSQGREVYVARSSIGKDFNDLLMAGAG